jgi:hypothetical protein
MAPRPETTQNASPSRPVLALVLCILVALACGEARVARASVVSPYFAAPFKVKKHRHAFGQAPSWTGDGQVLSGELDSAGVTQVYRANASGHGQICLTCRTVQGPNAFPQERPQADWIMFASYGQQPVHLGAPGFGGYGGDLYVMRKDGSHARRLTTTSDPNGGAQYSASSGVPYDNFHAYWSPSGRQVVWTHTEAHPLSEGGQTWEMLIGDFKVKHGVPSLNNVRVVGKPYGAYETQPWAPDGSGFLFTAAGGKNSPYQVKSPGWGHMQLYYMRLYGRGASPSNPRVTKISDDTPAYNEQAIFTPDMKTVIMMSNRSRSQDSWYNLVVAAAMRTGFDAPHTGVTQTLQFLADFVGPDFNSDLYAVDVKTKAIRQLTHFPNGVVPEFFWNRDHSELIWSARTGAVSDAAALPTYVGRFGGISDTERQVPKKLPASLKGKRVDMARVGGQAQAIRDPGPTDNVSLAASPPSNASPAFPHAPKRVDQASIPGVTFTYLGVWLGDLAQLSQLSGQSFTNPPLLGGR